MRDDEPAAANPTRLWGWLTVLTVFYICAHFLIPWVYARWMERQGK